MRDLPPYSEFLASKRILAPACGFDVKDSQLNDMLKPFQKRVVKIACKRGKSATFGSTGTGKGFIALEWLRLVNEYTQGNVLLSAPLAVSLQFANEEAPKFHESVNLCDGQPDVKPGISVTNYESLHRFDLERFSGVWLDESSRLKAYDSATTTMLIDKLQRIPFKGCGTATPSPNDFEELGNHAEVLDVMTRSNMLAMFFEHDGGDTGKWVLKGHARKPFFRWVSSWAVAYEKPSDLGDYDDTGYDLPKLHVHQHVVKVDTSEATEGMLFRMPDMSATGLHKEMRLTCDTRAAKVADLIAERPDVPWLVWCNTDYEADAVNKAVPSIVEIRGSGMTDKTRESRLFGFIHGEIDQLLLKPKYGGFGLNLQRCSHMAFVGLSYSFEQVFQAIARCWRYGQTQEVHAHIVTAETEGPVLESFRRKERQHKELRAAMVAEMRQEQLKHAKKASKYEHRKRMEVPEWLKTEEEAA